MINVLFVVWGLGVAGAWEGNLHFNNTEGMGNALNLSSCWTCTALPRGNVESPLFGVPVSYANWSWPYDNLKNATLPSGESLLWRVGESCPPGQQLSKLPNGETLCWGFSSPLPARGTPLPSYTCGNNSIHALKFELQELGKTIFIQRKNDTAPRVGHFKLSALNGATICSKDTQSNSSGCPAPIMAGLQLNYSYSCVPDGLWWLCGDGHARKSLPDHWDGTCTLGYVIPQGRVINQTRPPAGLLRTLWKRSK